MTQHKNMEELKPSRELDAEVAEKVMGWTFAGGFISDPTSELHCDKWATDGNGHEKYFADVPHYSTDISAAWEIVEKLNSYFFCLKMLQGKPHVYFSDCHGGVFASPRFAEMSVPHAICLAALKAISPHKQEGSGG